MQEYKGAPRAELEEVPVVEVVDEETGEVVSSSAQPMPLKLVPLRRDPKTGQLNRKIPHIREVKEARRKLLERKREREKNRPTTLDEQMSYAQEEYEDLFSGSALSRPQRRASIRDNKAGGVGYNKKGRKSS